MCEKSEQICAEQDEDRPVRKIRRIGPATLILGDCYAVLEREFPDGGYDAIVTDSPYGAKNNNNYRRFSGGSESSQAKRGAGRSYPPIVDDDRPFDPAPFIKAKQAILWGFNHFNERLPAGGGLVWVKRKPEAFGTFMSDAELGWEKGKQGVFCFTSYPQAMARDRHHPTQKPVDLMEWCVQRTKGTVMDPFMGSGSTAVACVNLGRKFIGIEIVPEYFDIAVERVERAYEAAQAKVGEVA